MTVAVCIRCGATKGGALTFCTNCQLCPEENEDKAKSMILTDHFMPKENLLKIGRRIESGQPIPYPEELVRGYIEFFEKIPDLDSNDSCDLIIFGLTLFCVVLVALLIFLGIL